MAEKEKPWLPEGYCRFLEADSKYQRWTIPSKIMLGVNVLTIMILAINPNYLQDLLHWYVLPIDLAAFWGTVAHSQVPSLNILGKRAHSGLYSIASQIGQTEKWFDNRASKNAVIARVRDTINYASNFTPIRDNFDLNMTAEKRVQYLPTLAQISKFDKSERGSLRKALYIGEDYWKAVLKNDQTATVMLEGIKTRLSWLFSEDHFSF